MTVNRHSSRQEKLDASLLQARLVGAASYDRIAGYFRSSLLEVAGEAIENVTGKVRVVCNSDLEPADVETAKAAQQAMRQSWCASSPEKLATNDAGRGRFARLFGLLVSGKLEVRVLPDAAFGLVHGKAGVIRYDDGRTTSFLGSVNETLSAWRFNYELMWEDDSAEAARWVQTEFDTLWNHVQAVPLADFIVQDVKRLADRQETPLDDWRRDTRASPASAAVESPVYRQEFGLWAHQKYFVKLAFDAHRRGTARFVLADQVGLGKTVQLALAALLMALTGKKPVLILVPKPLLNQWQDELRDLLAIPSAVWMGDAWVDEQGIEHPVNGPDGVRRCPRRFGIVSQGLVVAGNEITAHLLAMSFECVICDESHRARRKKADPKDLTSRPEYNNLAAFLARVSARTKSMLLATATPVQLHPIEAWDLLSILAAGNEAVLGNDWSEWRKPAHCLPVVMGERALSSDVFEAWPWLRNPLPPRSEGTNFRLLRQRFCLDDGTFVASGDLIGSMNGPTRTLLGQIAQDFGRNHNPFIRHIVRRTRQYLEGTIDPATGEPYLKPIRVRLFGEGEDEAVALPPYLQDAYNAAQEFCRLLNQRVRGAGFLKTLLLRRMGSSIYAGRRTTEKMLATWGANRQATDRRAEIGDESIDVDDDDTEPRNATAESEMKNLTAVERAELARCLKALEISQDRDPKFQQVLDYLIGENWLARGCIIFSQYFDSAWWLAESLSRDHLPHEPVGLYAGGANSGILTAGQFKACARDDIKTKVKHGEVRLLIGTDAASEGLNLQRLGTLINLDLPWNPTRLEQRKGRIQRIGQVRDEVFVCNLRYRGSVEDRVHQLLADRLEYIFELFGQIPDVLESLWIDVAQGNVDEAKRLIDGIHQTHPFDNRYAKVENLDWESCAKVLSEGEIRKVLSTGW
ncbi:Helicase domain-containing protein [Paraburkholderia piptadeniae]|uniref:Helicase domain-containing protein n=1 Tax=Paraburkholderia piptadeniae TaxID=1701573 RepID=A0A1N7SWN5_9BURK|nr:phospholipase D-like domain-containing anti-phage protein [Paraburkholderia piptadeniae]SIT51344.1 Helicase domain-containing protein [Paraburkholderia piptadeniae]